MVKFDSDYAIFGTFAAEIIKSIPLAESIISYTNAIKGDAISPEGRIVAIADVFDALVSAKPYKKAFSYEKTYQIFKHGDGRVMPEHFDPELLELFLNNYEQFVELHQSLKD